LVNARGAAVSREVILDRVWHGDADGGIVNVYIHYLREKLETEGERIILASRGRGYSLTEKYAAAFKKEDGENTDADLA
jgi:two-component system OmpR family response regulator